MLTSSPTLTVPTTTAQALALGWSRGQLSRAVAQGDVRRVLRGVYVDAGTTDTPRQRVAAARLVLPERLVVCDRSGSWLHGVDHYEPVDLDVPPLLDVVARCGERTVRRGMRGGVRALLDEDVMLLDGVPVTTPLRTAADLACQRGRLAAAAVLDQFAREHGITTLDLQRLLPRYAGRRGVTQLRELALTVSPLADSPPESWLFRLVLDAQLPAMTRQVEVRLPEGTFYCDLGYPHLRIAVEYDGEEHHSSAADRERDARRRAALARAGWVVIVVRKGDLRGEPLDRWLRRLRSAVVERRRDPVPRYARGEGAGQRPRRW